MSSPPSGIELVRHQQSGKTDEAACSRRRLTTKLLALNVAQYKAKEHFDQVKDLWYGVRTPDGR